jgi:hypothetical protein
VTYDSTAVNRSPSSTLCIFATISCFDLQTRFLSVYFKRRTGLRFRYTLKTFPGLAGRLVRKRKRFATFPCRLVGRPPKDLSIHVDSCIVCSIHDTNDE